MRPYWARYIVDMDASEVVSNLHETTFVSGGQRLPLAYFAGKQGAPSLVISPGSGGHGHVFAELGFRMNERGYGVFLMPCQRGLSIPELVQRHRDALAHIAQQGSTRIGVFAEGLGGYAAFYLALAGGPLGSLVCQNSPAILDDPRWQEAILRGGGAGRRRRLLLPLLRGVSQLVPRLPIPIRAYLDFAELVDTSPEAETIEKSLIEAYRNDPDFVKCVPLASVLSLVETPPPRPLSELAVPTMFLVPRRGIVPGYFRELFGRLPPIDKRLVEVDGGVFWMVSHPRQAAHEICDWFDQTL